VVGDGGWRAAAFDLAPAVGTVDDALAGAAYAAPSEAVVDRVALVAALLGDALVDRADDWHQVVASR
jgi:hypothetical protein